MNETQREEVKTEPVYYTYKDRVFRMLFKSRKRLLELYNALNDTAYVNEDDLIVNTLENAIFMKMKNDVSFIIDCNMCLYEHQSGYCPNMPLRGFLYFADLYKKWCGDIDLCTGKQIKIPTPYYIVFYNGLEKPEEEFVQKLSDAIRSNLKQMALKDAVIEALEHCIKNDILKEFLLEQKSEVIAMSIYEYNEEYVRRTLLEEGQEIGYAEGRAEGKAEMLVENIEKLMQILSIDVRKACESIGITVEEYEQAKEIISPKSGEMN